MRASAVLREPADGHTLLFTATTHIQAIGLKMKLPYDPVKDFAPVTQTAIAPLVVMVRPDGPKTLEELVAIGKSRPVTFASFGPTSTGHIYGELLSKVAGVPIINVPYKGGAPAVTALLGGQVDASFVEATQALPYVKAGRLYPLAVTGEKRYADMPNVKTFKESGLNGFELRGWHGVLARGGTPEAVLERIADDIRAALNQPAIHKQLADTGVETVGSTPKDWGTTLRSEAKQWTSLIERTGVTSR